MAADIFKSLNSLSQISNSSLSSVLNKVNINFETLATSFNDYLTIVGFVQSTNSQTLTTLTVDNIVLNKLLTLTTGNIDVKIDDQGRIFALSFTGSLSQVDRLRLNPLAPSQLFLETGLPLAGIPGDVVFTGVDFFGYMGQSIGWKSLTFGSSDLEAILVKFDDAFAGSPGLGNNVQTVIQNIYNIIQNIITGTGGDVSNASNIGAGTGLFAQKNVHTLEFKSLTGSDNIQISSTGTEVNITATIGNPEDDTYATNGLFTDLTPLTPPGIPIDRFNEILRSLVPPPAPILTNWDGVKAGTHVQGKLSFDDADPIAGASYIGANNSPSPINVDGSWLLLNHPTSQIAERFGICSPTSGDITGNLNYQVAAHPSIPVPAYIAMSFGDADKGKLHFYVNGVEDITKQIDLTNPLAQDSTSGGVSSGISVSASTPSHFPQGDPFTFFFNRTGTFRLQMAHTSVVQGYNYVHIVHENGISFTRTLSRQEFIIDDNVTSTAYSSNSLHTLAMTGSKKLSGIDYHTGGTAQYNINIDNAYRNTYNLDSDAVSFTGNSNSYGLLLTAPFQALANCLGNELLQVNVVNKLATIQSPSKRIINNIIALTTNVKRTIQGNTSGGTSNIDHILLDNFNADSTNYLEFFDDENHRLQDGISYNLISDVSNNPWDGTQSLKDGTSGHTTGLQVIDGKLIYPTTNSYPADFRTSNILNGSAFNDGGVGGTGRNYTGLSGSRTFIRYFQQVSPTNANFTVLINGGGGTFVSTSTGLTGNNIHVEIKLPSQTGFMDAYGDFVTGQFADGDGARSATLGVGRAFGTLWGITVGVKNTANSGGFVIIRFTVGSSFTGNFSDITFNFV